MQAPPKLTNRDVLSRNRARALRSPNPAMFLQQEAVHEVQERLSLVNKSFTAPAIVTPFPHMWDGVLKDALVVEDSDILNLKEGAHDLVVHSMALHWASDPVGQIVQARRALKPDGLFLGLLFGGQTLFELRAALAESEVAITGGLSPRVAPMAEIRDLGSLLQRSGLALPVADNFTQHVTYSSALDLMRDLRAMGEGNALASRSNKPISREMLKRTEDCYVAAYGRENRITATFEIIVLTGWAPDASQPEPLRPGSATTRLADTLNAEKIRVDDPARPGRI